MFVFTVLVLALVFLGAYLGTHAKTSSMLLGTLGNFVVMALYYHWSNGAGSTGNGLADGLGYLFGVMLPNLAFLTSMWITKAYVTLQKQDDTAT